CRDPRAGALLTARLSAGREPPGLRALAGTLLGELKDPATAPALAAALPGLKAEAMADPALESVAVAGLRALVALGGSSLVDAAVALAGDGPPLLRRTALAALGGTCDAGKGAEALRAAARDRDAAVA